MAEKPVLLPCLACGKNVSSDANSCPKCGQPLSDRWELEGRAKQTKIAKRTKIGCSSVFLLLVILISVASYNAPKTPEERRAAYCTSDGSIHATGAAIYDVRQKLKMPNLDFGPIVSRWLGECNASVSGTIEAKNGFVGKAPFSFTAKMTYRPDKNDWEMVEFTLDGQKIGP